MPLYGNIRKFKFDLALTEERVFEPLSNDLINIVKKSLLEIIEEVFLPFETRNVVVDKIEIDVGIINPKDLNSLLRNFKFKLDDFVQKNLNKSTFQNQERLLEAIIFFIQNGYFPWWVGGVVSLNEMLLNITDSFQFSKELKLVLASNKKNYFRLFNILDSDAKKIVYQKILLQNEKVFNASISFFERLLMNYQLSKVESQKHILEEVEFFFVTQQLNINKDSLLFFKTLKYFSGFIFIPFSNFLRFIMEEVIHLESNQLIKSLLQVQSDIFKGYSTSLDRSNGIDIEKKLEFKVNLYNLEGLILYFQNGISHQLSFSKTERLKNLFESLLKKEDSKLLDYLKSISFYQNKVKLARLLILLDSQNYKLLIDFLTVENKKSESVKSIEDFIKISSQNKRLNELLENNKGDQKNILEEEIKSKGGLKDLTPEIVDNIKTLGSNFEALISFFEEPFVQHSFTSLEGLNRILVKLIGKRNQELFNYLTSSIFYNDQNKLSRLILLLNKENYKILITFLSQNQDKLDSVKYINEFISETNKKDLSINLSEAGNFELTKDEAFKTRLLTEDPLSSLITFFEIGISQVNLTILSDYSKLLEQLIEKNDQGLMNYISKKSFFNSKIRLERFFSSLSDSSLQKLIDHFGENNKDLLISDLGKIFSDRFFIKELLGYSKKSNITYSYKKSLLIDLLVSKSKKRSASSFIHSFIDRFSKDSSIERNELLFEFSKMVDKKKLDQSISKIFNALYDQNIDKYKISLKSKGKAKTESKEFSSLQLNVADVLTMSKSELEKVLIDLFKQLPSSRFTLEMFVFHRDYSKAFSVNLFSNVFKALKVISGIDFPKRIKIIKSLIEPQYKSQSLLAINKVAFQIIASKGFSMSPETFSESLAVTLINLYPQIFKNDKFQKTETILTKENTLQKLIKKTSKRSKLKTNDKIKPIDIEKFDSLLVLKQDILENQLSSIFSEEVISFHDSFASIISSTETLLAFLNQNYLDHELILMFSEITLQSEISKEFEKMINKENINILDLENNILEIQQTYNIISLNFSSLKVILRTFLIKKIGVLNNFKKFSVSEFSIDFFENIKRENYLNFQRLTFYLRTEESKKNPSKLAEALFIFNTSSKFSLTNLKLKNELFYKDLVYGFLKTGQIPEWASIENFNQQDVFFFIKSAIKSGDKSFISKLLSSKVMVERISYSIEQLKPFEINKFYQLIHFKTASFELYYVFELLEIFLDKVKLSPTESNNVYFLKLTLIEELWRQTSLISLIEKLMPFIQLKSKKTKKQILNFISSKFNLSKKLIELEKNVKFSDSELIEVLKYYLEFKTFPKHLKLYENQIQSQIKQFLLRQDYVVIELLREYKFKPLQLELLFIFISLASIIDSFNELILNKHRLSLYLGPVLKEVIKSPTFKKKSKLNLLINVATSFELKVTESTISSFYKNLHKDNIKGYNEFVSLLKEKLKITDIEELNQQNQLIEDFEFSQKTEELNKNEILDEIDILDYYLEIGSVNYENKSLTKNELYKILLNSIKEAQLLIKKMVFGWLKSKVKLKRLIGIIPQNKQSIIINLIHPDLSKSIILFSTSMEKVLNKSIEEILSIKTRFDLNLKIIQFWLKKSIYIDSPLQIIMYLFEEVLEKQQITSNEFFKDFRDADFEYALETSNFIFNLKRTYDNYKNQLSESNILENKEDSVLLQEDSEGIVIQNAGLIILWPFFYRLFDKCNLLIDKKFKNDSAVQKGVILMQYLVTGSLKINENELVLNKILCGVDLRTPIDVNLEIQDVDLEMCDSLLNGVLKNWEKLNNSSIDALRETFLMREGILKPNELNYNLDIIKETFDMLLETIPWNISIIQTTFMENRINVDWK